MAKLSRDLATPVGGVSTLNGRETLIVSGALASLNAEIILAADGCSSFAVDLRGTFSGTFEVAGTIDGVNYTPIPVRPVNAASVVYVAAIAGTEESRMAVDVAKPNVPNFIVILLCWAKLSEHRST